ncbi:hypothetical protein P7C73_g4350, partial [Tremellales sp. Uapishka_1]
MNLTLSTNVEYLLVASTECQDCTNNAVEYDPSDSASLTATDEALSYTAIYPAGTSDTLTFSALFVTEHLTDARGDFDDGRTTALINAVGINGGSAKGGSSGTATTLSAGTSGFWGLGIDQVRRSPSSAFASIANTVHDFKRTTRNSLIPSMLITTDSGGDATYFTVGFDISRYSSDTTIPAGIVHWGGVPQGAYEGSFNWLNVNTTVGGSWGIGLDRMQVAGKVIDVDLLYGTLDPGFDDIYVPTNVAESFFASVPGSSRDLVDTTRWNLPCDTNISMSITISSTEYRLDSSQLVVARDKAGQTCWSTVTAWQNGSLPESLGEIRLGTPFMSGVYSVLYYTESEQLVGIAGKPDSVNDSDIGSRTSSSSHVNGKLAGALIGSLLGVLIVLLAICYSRNRNSFQSLWYRALRRQQRAQMNAVVRASTLPPPMMGLPVMGGPPPMMVQPQMMGMPPMMMPPQGPMHPATRYGFQPPPRYQAPIEPPQAPFQNHAPMPQVVEHSPQGFYSPRPHSHRGAQWQTPAQAGSSKVRFGSVAARPPTISSSAASQIEYAQVPHTYQEFGMNPNPKPNPPNYPQTSPDKKRGWGWRPRGEYSPVQTDGAWVDSPQRKNGLFSSPRGFGGRESKAAERERSAMTPNQTRSQGEWYQ